MRRRPMSRRDRPEPTLPLINIVFLMLIFFLVAAQLARPLDSTLSLVKTDDPRVIPPADALVLHADGHTSFRGADADAARMMATLQQDDATPVARILPDRAADAVQLITLAAELRALGASKVLIVTEQALK